TATMLPVLLLRFAVDFASLFVLYGAKGRRLDASGLEAFKVMLFMLIAELLISVVAIVGSFQEALQSSSFEVIFADWVLISWCLGSWVEQRPLLRAIFGFGVGGESSDGGARNDTSGGGGGGFVSARFGGGGLGGSLSKPAAASLAPPPQPPGYLGAADGGVGAMPSSVAGESVFGHSAGRLSISVGGGGGPQGSDVGLASVSSATGGWSGAGGGVGGEAVGATAVSPSAAFASPYAWGSVPAPAAVGGNGGSGAPTQYYPPVQAAGMPLALTAASGGGGAGGGGWPGNPAAAYQQQQQRPGGYGQGAYYR
ncbi:hypothetical protein HK405_011746, partial [Cladochytrium tenue]